MREVLRRVLPAATGLMRLAVMLVAVVAAAPAFAQSIWSASHGEDVWVVLSETDRGLSILHRKASDAPEHYWKALTLPGMLASDGMAAGDRSVWLVYSDGAVRGLHSGNVSPATPGLYAQEQFAPSLPEGVQLRSLTASGEMLWALVDVKTAQAMRRLEAWHAAVNPDVNTTADAAAVTEEQAAARSSSDHVDDQTDQARTQLSSTTKEAGSEAAEQPFEQKNVLLRLRLSRWSMVSLPTDWQHGSRAWLVMTSPDEEYPAIVAERPGVRPSRLRVYRHVVSQSQSVASEVERGRGALPVQWEAQDVSLPESQGEGAGDVAFVGFQNQLVMATRQADEERLRVTLWVLRPRRDEAVRIGGLALDAPSTSNWSMTANGLSLTLLARQGTDLPLFTSMNLMGQVTHAPGKIVIEQPPLFVQDPGQMLPVAVVAISIFLMFLVWRRDPNMEQSDILPQLVLADFGRRALAAGIDLAPCVFLSLLVTKVDLGTLYDTWPGRSGSWEDLFPALLTIGLFIFHTGLTEMFTGRTLGKKICGLRVVSTDGSAPNVWQVLARNGLKSFDLIACYILPILMLVGRYRQRLGDLVGKTLVVVDSQQTQPPSLDEARLHDEEKSQHDSEPDSRAGKHDFEDRLKQAQQHDDSGNPSRNAQENNPRRPRP